MTCTCGRRECKSNDRGKCKTGNVDCEDRCLLPWPRAAGTVAPEVKIDPVLEAIACKLSGFWMCPVLEQNKMIKRAAAAGAAAARFSEMRSTGLLDADAQRTLLHFATLFAAMHQEICKHGGTQIHEYMEIWHVYKDDVLPLLKASNGPLDRTEEAKL